MSVQRRLLLIALHNQYSCMDCEQIGEGKSQVDEIIEHFNINAGNPAICMTQVGLVTHSTVLLSVGFRRKCVI